MKRGKTHTTPRPGLSLMLILVASLFFWSQAGFVFWQVSRNINYSFLREKPLSKERDTIIVSQSEFSTLLWIKKDEIRYNGKMFDVKRQYAQDGSMVLTGHYDTHDDKLFSWLHKMLDGDGHSTHGKHKFQFWFCEAIVDTIAFAADPRYTESTQYYSKESALHSVYFSHISPPPRAC